ncbi:MAG: hypothetical protein QGH01_00175, partial [Alphaproteobacteria bacterium]|nr:hypothetical protein [Alphaproteobacteria bacterium]
MKRFLLALVLPWLLVGAPLAAFAQPPGKRDQAGEATMRREMSALDERINGIDRRLATAFPEYAELTAPKP